MKGISFRSDGTETIKVIKAGAYGSELVALIN